MYMLLNILNVQAHYNQVNENKISFILVYESYRNFKYILVNWISGVRNTYTPISSRNIKIYKFFCLF